MEGVRPRSRRLPSPIAATLLLLLALPLATLVSARVYARDYERLPSNALASVALLSDPAPILDHRKSTSLLSAILIPRVPESKGNLKVRELLLAPFRNLNKARDAANSKAKGAGSPRLLGWDIQEMSFVAQTPEGPKRMSNLILTKDPSAPRKLVVAAHYDTLSRPEGFLGATDSAMPCAVLVDLALALDEALERREERLHAAAKKGDSWKRNEETTLQIVFFDGEEAYRRWSHTDSIYGSKNLASNWTTSYYDPAAFPSRYDFEPSPTRRRLSSANLPSRHIDTMEHLVLLDLLGAAAPRIPSYFPDTQWLHAELRSIESRLKEAGLLYPKGMEKEAREASSFFPTDAAWGGIEDDHLPFLANGVPVLHLIPSPFPQVWHTMKDDASALDYPTAHAWSMLMRVLVAEYLGLDLVPAKLGSRRPQAAAEDRERSEELEEVVGALEGGSLQGRAMGVEAMGDAGRGGKRDREDLK